MRRRFYHRHAGRQEAGIDWPRGMSIGAENAGCRWRDYIGRSAGAAIAEIKRACRRAFCQAPSSKCTICGLLSQDMMSAIT